MYVFVGNDCIIYIVDYSKNVFLRLLYVFFWDYVVPVRTVLLYECSNSSRASNDLFLILIPIALVTIDHGTNLLINSKLTYYPQWFCYACIAYGAHTATTMALFSPPLRPIDVEATLVERIMLFGVYLPYLIFPLWILSIAVTTAGAGAEGEESYEVPAV